MNKDQLFTKMAKKLFGCEICKHKPNQSIFLGNVCLNCVLNLKDECKHGDKFEVDLYLLKKKFE